MSTASEGSFVPEALADLARWLDSQPHPAMLIGGVAASLRGRPRYTQDIDVLAIVEPGVLAEFAASGKAFGFEPRIPDVLSFAEKSRVLLLRHVSTGIDVDISLGLLPFEFEALERATREILGEMAVSVAAAEDLIVMKALAGRPRDLSDIAGILEANPALDRGRVTEVIRGFASLLEEPAVLTRLEGLL